MIFDANIANRIRLENYKMMENSKIVAENIQKNKNIEIESEEEYDIEGLIEDAKKSSKLENIKKKTITESREANEGQTNKKSDTDIRE